MYAYSELYLYHAQTNLAVMLEYGIHEAGFPLDGMHHMFLVSGIADAFGHGFSRYLAGMSGIELAHEVFERCGMREELREMRRYQRTPEYWTGWALAFYQWHKAVPFAAINEYIPIDEIRDMYHPYHEMDLTRFAEEVDRRISARKGQTHLARLRNACGFSQHDLSEISGVPVRTIQQYEQRVKDINKAGGGTLCAFAQALYCRVEDLMEIA